jgi:hypothetical protein
LRLKTKTLKKLKSVKIQISKQGQIFKRYWARAKKLDAVYAFICKDNFLKQQRSMATKCEFLA